MKKIRIVHYGIGHDHSNQFMTCLKGYPDLYEIVGICEPNEEVRKKFGGLAAYKDLRWLTEEEMFSRTDVDAAIVEAYDLDLVKYAQKCAACRFDRCLEH
jgi:predicted dehydrogenase